MDTHQHQVCTLMNNCLYITTNVQVAAMFYPVTFFLEVWNLSKARHNRYHQQLRIFSGVIPGCCMILGLVPGCLPVFNGWASDLNRHVKSNSAVLEGGCCKVKRVPAVILVCFFASQTKRVCLFICVNRPLVIVDVSLCSLFFCCRVLPTLPSHLAFTLDRSIGSQLPRHLLSVQRHSRVNWLAKSCLIYQITVTIAACLCKLVAKRASGQIACVKKISRTPTQYQHACKNKNANLCSRCI